MPQAKIFIFFGLIASGKSTLAETWAKNKGFVYLNSDRIRKELAGLEVHEGQKTEWSKGIYTAEFSRRTYDALLERAQEELRQDRGVVLDASYSLQAERIRVRKMAENVGEECVFILCSCSEEEVKTRLAKRARDPHAVSDGNWEIYVVQKERFEFPTELAAGQLITMDTQENPAKLLLHIEETLKAS